MTTRHCRIRIWDVDCALLDAILALSFDPQELLNSCQSAEAEVSTCRCLTPDHRAVVSVHRACHQPSRLAELTERRLDVVHRQALDRLELGIESLARELLGADLTRVPHLAGKLWAVATSSEPRAEALRRHLGAALNMAGLRLLAGAREQTAAVR